MAVQDTIRQNHLRPLSAVWCEGDAEAWAIAQTPSEIAGLVRGAIERGEVLIELILANNSDWNGRSVFLKPQAVIGIAPPVANMLDEFED